MPLLRRLASAGEVVIALPTMGSAVAELAAIGRVEATGHSSLFIPRSVRELLELQRGLLGGAKRFRALLRAHRANLVLISTTTLPTLTLAARLEGIPTVVYAAELYEQGRPGDGLRVVTGRTLARLNQRLATVTVVPSQRVAAQLPARRNTAIVHPSIDPDVALGDAAEFHRAHGLPTGGPWLATLGNISRGRGQDNAIRALALLRRGYPNAQLIVAGAPHPRKADHAFEAELRSLASELGVDTAVHLVGFVRPGDLLALCNVLLNPARVAESFGRAALEALAAGRPVVSSNVGSVPDLLVHGKHALLVAADDPDAIAGAVGELLRDPDLATRLAEAGRDYVLSTFTIERQLASFDEAITTATGRPLNDG